MNILEVRKTVAKIKGQLFKNSNSKNIGTLKSKFKGSGLQFKEHRVYGPGDEVRFIDWKMLAKTDQPYIKVFEEERNVEITVVIDLGPTMLMGLDGVSKLQASIEICCLLFLLAKDNNDYIRVLILGPKVIEIPKGNGEKAIVRLISILEKEEILLKTGKVNLNYSIDNSKSEEIRQKEIIKHLYRKREVIFLSDFIDFKNEDLWRKVFFRSNLRAFKISSPIDRTKSFPFVLGVKNKGSLFLDLKQINFKTFTKDDKSIFKRMKEIKLEDNYLDHFIRDML